MGVNSQSQSSIVFSEISNFVPKTVISERGAW